MHWRGLRPGDVTGAYLFGGTLKQALADPAVKTAFDVFGTDLPDEAFSGICDPRANAAGAKSTCEGPDRYK